MSETAVTPPKLKTEMKSPEQIPAEVQNRPPEQDQEESEAISQKAKDLLQKIWQGFSRKPIDPDVTLRDIALNEPETELKTSPDDEQEKKPIGHQNLSIVDEFPEKMRPIGNGQTAEIQLPADPQRLTFLQNQIDTEIDLIGNGSGLSVVDVPRPARSNAINPARAQEWLNAYPSELRPSAQTLLANIHHISQADFEVALEQSLKSINKKINPDEPFGVVIDQLSPSSGRARSSAWVTNLAIPNMDKLPQESIRIPLPSESLPAKPKSRQFIIFDDVAFSGGQTRSSLKKFVQSLESLGIAPEEITIYLVIPFMTKAAEFSFSNTSTDGEKVVVAGHKQIPTLGEAIEDPATINILAGMFNSYPDTIKETPLTYFDHKAGAASQIAALVNRGSVKDVNGNLIDIPTLIPKTVEPYK